MNVDKHDMVKGFSQGDAVVIIETGGRSLQGYLSKIDVAQDRLVLRVGADIGYDGKVEREHLVELKFADIAAIGRFGSNLNRHPTLEDELKNYPIGKYLMIWGTHDNSINLTIQQGQLKSINWEKRTLVLYNTTYKEDRTVNFDRISSIDASRSGPGAASPASVPDWYMRPDGAWYRGEQEHSDGGDK